MYAEDQQLVQLMMIAQLVFQLKDQKIMMFLFYLQPKSIGLQARETDREHLFIDQEGTADISSSSRFGIIEALVTKRLFEGLIVLYQLEKITVPDKGRNHCCITF
ncbi:unnamed protein product [Paramecium primaurelia]|uniref:Uncharacterized protein n=1 Tax=Paramecium primaurelia TaxID=5886 RepID=A0A8S1L9B6_PARPR|nr:unnamed protein product [Paramecium primaurelia]